MTVINLTHISSGYSTTSKADSVLSQPIAFKNSVIAFGVFDGLHIGHKYLINRTIQISKYYSTTSAVLTFDIDPDELFNKKSLTKISDNNIRIEKLINCGVNDVFILQFTKFVASLSPIDFLTSLLGNNFPRAIVVGENFKFGCNASGDIDTLKKWGNDVGVEIVVVSLIHSDGKPISSSRIRSLIANKDFTNANRLLGK